MKLFYQYKILPIMFSFLFVAPIQADNLGRIYTSADDRQRLEKIRHQKPKKIEAKNLKKEELIANNKELIIREPITLKGLVHRTNGKSTAWVNESNTADHDLESKNIQVTDSQIEPNQVTIIMLEDNTNVDLRVGDVYTPEPVERDIIETNN